MTKGTIIAVSGPVVDVSFEKGSLPAIREELRVTVEDSVRIMEVAQHVDATTVRCIMLSDSEGLYRGNGANQRTDVACNNNYRSG